MESRSSKEISDKTLSVDAFILYQPQEKDIRENVFYNEEAGRIFSFSVDLLKEADLSSEILSCCAKWKEVLESRFGGLKESANEAKGTGFLDIIISQRRRYSVRGIVLSRQLSEAQQKAHQYLFILERFSPDSLNLSLIFRQLNLTPREKDIALLLLEDRSNKEIAHLLGLSLNTVKGYMKLLMRKLRVGSRAGIVASFLEKG